MLRRRLVALTAVAFFAAPYSAAAAGNDAAAAVPFHDLQNGHYFIKNTVRVDPRAFFIVRDERVFTTIFGYGATMGPSGPVISAATFATRMLLVAAGRSSAVCTYRTASVTQRAGAFTVRASVRCGTPGSATYTLAHVVVVPRGPIRAATFVENGKTVGTVAGTAQ